MNHSVGSDRLHTIGELGLSEIACVAPHTSVLEVAQLFVDLRVPAIAVVDAAQDVRGVITRTDVLRRIHDHAVTAEQLMSHYVLALPPDATIECAAALMAVEGVGHVVVIDERNEAIGAITSLDIARQVAARAGYLLAG